MDKEQFAAQTLSQSNPVGKREADRVVSLGKALFKEVLLFDVHGIQYTSHYDYSCRDLESNIARPYV